MIKLFENIWLKLLAVILGLLVWFHVATDKTYDYELNLPLVQVDLANDLTLAVNPPDSFLVKVSAKGKQLLRKQWQAEGLRINAQGLGVGEHQLSLSSGNTFVAADANNVSLEEIILPAHITLTIDSLGMITVPVTSDIEAEPDEGFAVGFPVKIDPPEITLRGARSKLRRFGTVLTEKTKLTGLRNDISLRLALVTPPSFGVSLDPDSVTLTLEVIPVKTRVFQNVPVVIYNVPPGLHVVANPARVTIELTGPPTAIDILPISAITASADFRQADEYGDTPLNVDYPLNFNLKRTSHTTIKLVSQPAS
jgi:hypothetical protein